MSGVGWYFDFFIQILKGTFCKQTGMTVVCAVCLCPTKKDAVLIWVKIQLNYQVGLDN